MSDTLHKLTLTEETLRTIQRGMDRLISSAESPKDVLDARHVLDTLPRAADADRSDQYVSTHDGPILETIVENATNALYRVTHPVLGPLGHVIAHSESEGTVAVWSARSTFRLQDEIVALSKTDAVDQLMGVAFREFQSKRDALYEQRRQIEDNLDALTGLIEEVWR